MPTVEELERENSRLKQANEVLLKKINRYEKDAVYRGYYALNNIVNQQIDYLNKFDLDREISQNPKDDKVYDRSNKIWAELKTLIVDLDTLKKDLKISGDMSKDIKDVPFIETVAEIRK